MRRFVR